MWFKKSVDKKAVTKSLALYVSEKEQQIIIAPMYKNDAGAYYEQEDCTLIKYPLNFSFLGEAILSNFNLFAIKDRNLRDFKRSDWAAYKTSGLKTIKSFEEKYHRISVVGDNESNIILVFEGISLLDKDLTIQARIFFNSDKISIGKLVMKVYHACVGQFNYDNTKIK